MSFRGNKGEWSEIYAFLKMLGDGQIHGADTNLKALADRIFKIRQIKRDHLAPPRNYEVEENHIVVLDGKNNEIVKLRKNVFVDVAESLLNEIKAGSRTFSVPSVESFLNQIDVNQLKADSNNTADIFIKLYDNRTATQPTLGFSIKSLIGGDSTLFNPNRSTNFIYEIIPKGAFDATQFNTETYSRSSKISERVQRLINNDVQIKFSGIQSENLYKNLFFVDSALPEIISYLLLYRYYYAESSVSNATSYLEKENPLGFPEDNRDYYKYKIKRVLRDMAMGMTSDCIWNGFYEANGGTIVVKDSGEIVCYHVYDIQIFEDYLFTKTYFDTPSTGEDKNNPGQANPKNSKKYYHSWVYEENGKFYLKLNLQIRYSE